MQLHDPAPLAKRLRLFLLGETVFYVGVVWLLNRLGVGAGGKVVIVLLLALGGRAFVTFFTYAFAHAFRSPVPPQSRIGALDFLVMVAEEYFAFIMLFSVIQPFEHFFLGADRLARSATGRLPVLLVHGYQCNRGFWSWQRTRLQNAGWSIATLNLEPVFASIDIYGEQIHRRVEEICAATGTAQVNLVGHSMGGLAARAYLRAHGAARVARLVTLGAPHHGSRLALTGLGINARQMETDSEWLADLNEPGANPLPDRTATVWSPYDNYVMPQDSARLDEARTHNVGAVGHLAMAFSPAITSVLLAELGS